MMTRFHLRSVSVGVGAVEGKEAIHTQARHVS